MPETNANSKFIATVLDKTRAGSFSGLIIRKKGVERGPKGAKVRYGDDVVHVVVVTGFKYGSLVERSLEALKGITDEEIVVTAQAMGRDDVNMATVATARAELVQSFKRTLDPDQESTSTTAHVYGPLVVDDETVRGSRVYRCAADQGVTCHCRDCTGDPKAPLNGTIYLQGLQVWKKVLEEAPNGPAPEPKSKAKTVAKNLLRSKLPVAKYASYALEPGGEWMLRAGGVAAVEATQRGFLVTDEIVDLLAG